MFGRRQAAIVGAEFLGTGFLALVMLSVQHSQIGVAYFVALAAGITVSAATLIFGRLDGAHFNPAITIGLWTARQIKSLAALAYIVAQLLGAWAAYYLYAYLVKPNTQLQLTPIGGHYDGRVLVAEAVGALLLSLAFAAAVFNRYVRTQTALLVGAAYMLAIIVAGAAITTDGTAMAIGIVNPAVALSMRAFAVFGSMGWGTYALGPVLGAIIGVNLYAILFAPESSLTRMRAVLGGKSAGSVSGAMTVSSAMPMPAEAASGEPKTAKPVAGKRRTGRSSGRKPGKK
ncbi:MAG TPA: aquaporin [Candidatus Saccharimonadales bacterium]|nr:aquaporin [Candidatus Saccharimonadales bacterium]